MEFLQIHVVKINNGKLDRLLHADVFPHSSTRAHMHFILLIDRQNVFAAPTFASMLAAISHSSKPMMFLRLALVVIYYSTSHRHNIWEMGKYSDSDEWDDIIPIPQDDGGPNPLAAIAYTEEYSEAMSYLRAAMAGDEKSDRALELTEDIIRMNPAHYTVWYITEMTEKVATNEYMAGFTEQIYYSLCEKTFSKSWSG